MFHFQNYINNSEFINHEIIMIIIKIMIYFNSNTNYQIH